MESMRRSGRSVKKSGPSKEKQKELACSEQHARAAQDRAKEVSELLAGENPGLTEYSDTLVYRIVEQITVLSKEKIRIRFTGGLNLRRNWRMFGELSVKGRQLACVFCSGML